MNPTLAEPCSVARRSVFKTRLHELAPASPAAFDTRTARDCLSVSLHCLKSIYLPLIVTVEHESRAAQDHHHVAVLADAAAARPNTTDPERVLTMAAQMLRASKPLVCSGGATCTSTLPVRVVSLGARQSRTAVRAAAAAADTAIAEQHTASAVPAQDGAPAGATGITVPTFQDAIFRLQQFWCSHGCLAWLPHNTEARRARALRIQSNPPHEERGCSLCTWLPIHAAWLQGAVCTCWSCAGRLPPPQCQLHHHAGCQCCVVPTLLGSATYIPHSRSIASCVAWTRGPQHAAWRCRSARAP